MLQQRRACGAQKPPFEKHYDEYKAQLYQSCARQVSVADMLAFVRNHEGAEDLAGAIYTSPEELERNAARPSRPRMLLYTSRQNCANLSRMARWCGKSSNVKLLKALGSRTPAERHAIAQMVQRLCHPACICVNCRSPDARFLSLTIHDPKRQTTDSGASFGSPTRRMGSMMGSMMGSTMGSGGWGGSTMGSAGARSPTMQTPSRRSSRGYSPSPARFDFESPLPRTPDRPDSPGSPGSPASSRGSSRPTSPANFF